MDPNIDDYEFDPYGLSEKKKAEATEQKALTGMIEYPRVSQYFDFMQKYFEQPLKEIALTTSPDQRYLMDMYLPADILKMFNGLEIHNLSKAFSKFKNEISLEAFIIIGFRILDIPKETSPYVLFGLIMLYESLTIRKGKKSLTFRDFLNNFIRIQSMFSEHTSYVNEDIKTIRFFPSNIQDNSHHDNPIRNAFYSRNLKLIFCLNEGADHIKMYSANMEQKGKIYLDKKAHSNRMTLIIDFAWNEKKKKVGLCLQDLSVSFFSNDDNFTKEEHHPTTTLQYAIWYVDFCSYWFTTDTLHDVYYWDSNHNQVKVEGRPRAKVACIGEVSNLGLVAISSFDKKITMFNTAKNVVSLVITADDCSAHTLRYSKEHNMFFAATFGQIIRIYQIDKAKDYTKVGKLESPGTTTALDLLQKSQLIVTCDDEGNLKSWDDYSFKSLQHHVFHSIVPVSKIINMEDVGKFCVVSNRINLFDLRHITFNQDKNHQAVPLIRYCADKEEIIVALNGDMRIFSLRYGILSELYDKEVYNVDDSKKIVYFKKSSKWDQIFFVDDKGFLRQLTVSTNPKANQGFQPFKTDNSNFIYDEQDGLLVTWYRNGVKIYRYEANTHTHLLLRSMKLPEAYHVTSAKIYKAKGVLATILNHSLLVFWEYHKLNVCGAFTMAEDNLRVDSEENIPATPASISLKKSPFSFIRESPTFNHQSSKTLSPAKKRYTEEKTLVLKPTFSELKSKNSVLVDNMSEDRNSANRLLQNPTTEILDMQFIPDYNCFVIIDGRYEISLIENKAFEDFGSRIKVNLGSKIQSPDYSYLKMKVKPIDFKLLIEQKALNPTEIENIYFQLDPEDQTKDIQHLVFICDSEYRIIVFNLNPILARYFKQAKDDRKFKQPYYSTQIEFNEADLQGFIEKAKQTSKTSMTLKPVFDVPTSKMTIWRTGDTLILDTKVVVFNTVIIITLNQNCSLNLWNLKGELVGQLSVKDNKRTVWNLNQYNLQQRVEVFQKTKDLFDSIHNKFKNEISYGVQNALDTKFHEKIKKEMGESDLQNEKAVNDVKTKRVMKMLKKTTGGKEDEKVTSTAAFILERDQHMLHRQISRPEFVDREFLSPTLGTMGTIGSAQILFKKKPDLSTLASSYLQNLSKKLAETVPEQSEATSMELTQAKSKDRKKNRSPIPKTDPKLADARLEARLKAQQERSLVAYQKLKKQSQDKRLNTDFDYIDLYVQATANEGGLSFDSQSEMRNNIPSVEDSMFKNASRSVKRVNLLKDLESRKNKMKNSYSGVDVKESLINLAQNVKDYEKSKLLEKYRMSEFMSLKSINGGTTDSSQILNTSKVSPLRYAGQRISQIQRIPLFPETGANTKVPSVLDTTKDPSPTSKTGVYERKRVYLPTLKYDPRLDEEIIQNMDTLDTLNKNMSKKAQGPQKRFFNEFAQEIQQCKTTTKKGLQTHLLYGDSIIPNSNKTHEFLSN